MAIKKPRRKKAFVGVRMTQDEVDAMMRLAELNCTSGGAILRMALRKFLYDAGLWPPAGEVDVGDAQLWNLKSKVEGVNDKSYK